ncbi:MAG TPA: 3-phosphoserine/phosphohydroxythreonine transaminase [Fibrobacteria bacterium]|nr:3-phosphoserine/phosphohydroxythreonine transaminase [Fibrobacteria bacterium]
MPKIHNFSAGPGILPRQAMEAGAKACLEFNGKGLSLLEMSHRGKDFIAVMEQAVSLVKELLGVPSGYSVVFLQGGASMQFAMVPYNLLDESESAAYLDTGTWANKAIKEAKLFGNVKVVASSKEANYTYIPKGYEIPGDAKYFHVTSNNTIFGTQMQHFPESPVPVVADMSSDIFSRPVDVSKFGLIYAGAQKNMGIAGTTLVIVRDDLLGKVKRKIPSMLDYKIHIAEGSMYNTPPVFPVYMAMETLKWVKQMGGVSAMQKRAEEKAQRLYKEIDENPLFKGTTAKEDRSRMNVTFVMAKPGLEEAFGKEALAAGLSGLPGHRSVGGFRASIYNALELESIDALVSVMRDFARKNA